MFARLSLAMAALALAPSSPCLASANPASPPAVDVAGGKALAAKCAGKEGFGDPAPPVRIYGNAWYVGTCNVSSVLLTAPEGLVLIDSGPADAVSSILDNIRTAGFDPKSVRWIVFGHEHYDHVGGLAALKRATGAKVAAMTEAVSVLSSGRPSADDPQAQEIAGFEPVVVDRVLRSGDMIEVGSIRLLSMALGAHTEGSTSWSWTSCEGGDCRKLTYLDSVSAFPLGTYRFRDHPARLDQFRRTLAIVERLDCGIVITPHASASALFERLSGEEPLHDPLSCQKIARTAQDRLEKVAAK